MSRTLHVNVTAVFDCAHDNEVRPETIEQVILSALRQRLTDQAVEPMRIHAEGSYVSCSIQSKTATPKRKQAA